jgi:biotin carboxyl carrier protein
MRSSLYRRLIYMKKFLIKVNGNQYEVEVEEIKQASSGNQAVAQSASQSAPKAVPVGKAAKVDNSVPAGAVTITAPMPGTVLRLNVAMDDVVKKGQVLLILEAMKMENEIVAPNDGTVVSINAVQGGSVNVGDVLVSLS